MTNDLNKKFQAPVQTPLAGTMKGTITPTDAPDKKFDYTSTVVIRRSQNGIMRVESKMTVQDADTPVHVEFQLVGENAPSKTYKFDDPEVEALFIYNPYDPFYTFNAISGYITLENHTPESRITGVLDFTAEAVVGWHQYHVEMVFEVTGVTTVTRPGKN